MCVQYEFLWDVCLVIMLTVYVCVLCMVYTLTVEACEAEHANLLCDVVPGPRCSQFLQLSFQLSPHQQDSVSHGLHICLPGVKGIKKE